MAYTKTVWVNDQAPAINQTNLNKIEQGIYDADERSINNETNIGDLTQLTTPVTNSIVGAINSIVESGNNTYGNYIKYTDGTMICTREISYNNVSLSSQWGSWYYYDDTSTYDFAQTFIDTPHIQLTWISTSPAGACLGNYGNSVITSSAYKGIMLFRPTTQTVTGKVFIQAIGRWK